MVIRRDTGIDAVSYFHLEFDSYAVIYAEGAPAESFVDGESRAMFDNVADYTARFPLGIHESGRFCAHRGGCTARDRAPAAITVLASFGNIR